MSASGQRSALWRQKTDKLRRARLRCCCTKKDILGNDEKRFARLYYGLQERQKLTSTSAGRRRRTTSGRPISDSCPPEAAASRRAPCQSRPSLRISSAQLLDCSVGALPAPDLPRGLRAALPLQRSEPPARRRVP